MLGEKGEGFEEFCDEPPAFLLLGAGFAPCGYGDTGVF